MSPSFAALICQRIAASVDEADHGRMELDSHADSPVLGKGALIVRETGKRVSVKGFADELGKSLSVPVVDGVVAYDDEYDGSRHLIMIRNALSVPSMSNHLIPPFMMRLAGLEVNECAKFLAKKPSIHHHSILFPDPRYRIPLSLTGITSYIPTRLPKQCELDDLEKDCVPLLEITPQVNHWNPHATVYQDQEDAMLDYKGNLKEPRNERKHVLSSLEQSVEHTHCVSGVIDRSLDPVLLAEDLVSRRYCSNVESGSFGQSLHNVSCMRTTREQHVYVVKNNGAKSDLTSVRLAEVFGISNSLAVKTMNVATRLCPRNTADITLNRRYSTNDRMLRYSRMLSDCFMDTMFAAKPRTSKNGKEVKGTNGKSVRGFTCAQVFATEFGWTYPVLLQSKKDIHMAVKKLFKKYGVPPSLIMDAAREQIWGEVRVICQHAGADLVYLEKGTHNANRAERSIETLKQGTKKDLHDANAPAVFWCYGLERRAAINNSIAKDNVYCQGQTPETVMTGQPTDISSISEFKFYEWVKYKREGVQFPFSSYQLGRCLGPAIDQGSRMCQNILTEKGTVMPLQTVRRLTPAEVNSPFEVDKRKAFDTFIYKRFGDPSASPEKGVPDVYDWSSHLEEPEAQMPEADDFADYAAYINAEVLLPQNGEHMRAARVVGLAKDTEGMEKGSYNPNPVLDTRVYEVMFPDGAIEQYCANLIAENLVGQVDEDGHMYRILESIDDHRVDGSQATIQGSNTTRGHEIQCTMKDGTVTWIPLKDMKESYPIEMAEFAVSMDLVESPAFKWWVPYVLRKRDQIIARVQHRLVKKSFKYGHSVPSNVQEAYALDTQFGNTRWRDAIAKEMKNVRIAFKILEPEENLPPAHEFVPCHMIFDVKMDGTAKARLVAAGCRTSDPAGSTWAGVVSRETVRLALVYAALNDLEVMSADIQNAYLTAPTSQKLWTTCGREFGADFKKRAVITRALYGNKAAGADFRNHLRDCMELLNYFPCKADPDLWMREAVKDNGDKYYEYVLLYVDDALAIGEHPKEQLLEIDKFFMMKPGSIEKPKIYLGAKLSVEELPNGAKAWGVSSSKYIQDSIKNLESKMEKKNLKLRSGVKAPLSKDYRPELDSSPELNTEDASLYQSLIGSLRWMVEMGRIDICCEVSMMSSHVAMPREGHLQQLYQMYGYLKTHHNARIMLDPSYPNIEEDDFPKHDWSTKYKTEGEVLPPNAPTPYGMELVIRGYVDADHAGDQITRRSRTGFIVFVNMAPIHWISKKQSGVETSTFGSEFIAMKVCCEYLRGLRYKIRMMGIPLEHCCYVYGDNKSVLYNTTLPDSTIKKKSHSVAYHYVREGCASDEWRTTYIKTDDNCGDICTKSLPSGINRKQKVRTVMYDIYPMTEKEMEH